MRLSLIWVNFGHLLFRLSSIYCPLSSIEVVCCCFVWLWCCVVLSYAQWFIILCTVVALQYSTTNMGIHIKPIPILVSTLIWNRYQYICLKLIYVSKWYISVYTDIDTEIGIKICIKQIRMYLRQNITDTVVPIVSVSDLPISNSTLVVEVWYLLSIIIPP